MALERKIINIEIYRVSCRACDEIFCGMTLEEAENKYRQHIKKCETIKALEKIEKFRKKTEKILGRKMTFLEASKLLTSKK